MSGTIAGEGALPSRAGAMGGGGGKRPRDGFLSVLAQAPDLGAAASFLLAELQTMAGAERSCFLRYRPTDDALVVEGQLGRPDLLPGEHAIISDPGHPWMVATLAMTPVIGEQEAGREVGYALSPWTALPMPVAHYRGAPALISDLRAAQLLGASGAKLVPLDSRAFSSAPGGVIVLEGLPGPSLVQELAEAVMLAGPVIDRLAALGVAEHEKQRLTQEHERLTQMINSLPDPVVITNAANDIVAQNPRAERLFFAGEDDSAGRRRAIEVNNLLFSSLLSRAMMTGALDTGSRELNLVDPDEGADLLFEVLAHPMGDLVGPQDAFLSVLRDVTDLRRASNELERQVRRVRQAELAITDERDRLNLILKNVADPIIVTDDAAKIILMNEPAAGLFSAGDTAGLNRGELRAVRGNDTKFTSFISDFMLEDRPARRAQMLLADPRADAAGGRMAELPVEVVAGKIKNDRGEPIAIVSVLHDLTSHVENQRLYEALKQLNSELEQRIAAATADLAAQNQRLQWQSDQLSHANKLKSDFLASMSHELRTPLDAIIGYTSLILDGTLGDIDATVLEYLKRSRAAAQHLLSLISDILDLSRIEAGKMPVHIEAAALGEILRDVAQQVEPMVRTKNLAFEMELARGCPSINTDRKLLKQVLLNLLSNAVKFTNKGSVRLAARCEDGEVYLEVSDTGIGIRPEDLDQVWEDFRQLDQSRTRMFGGTGLGLSITKRLLEALRGRVSVDSVFGEGTTFTVVLPIGTRE